MTYTTTPPTCDDCPQLIHKAQVWHDNNRTWGYCLMTSLHKAAAQEACKAMIEGSEDGTTPTKLLDPDDRRRE